MNTQTTKQGRNEECSCGSGLKHKKCCGRQKKMLTQRGLLKSLLFVIMKAEGLVIDAQDIENLSDDIAINVSHNPDTDEFTLTAAKAPEPKLIQIAKTMPKIMN